MSLRRVTDRYHPDSAGAQRRAKGLLEWIMAHKDQLQAASKRRPYVVQDAKRLYDDVKRGHDLLPEELSKVDEFYELVMKGSGLPSVPRHHDLGRR